MECRQHETEITRLRAELSRALARAERAEETVRLQAEALVTLARHAGGVTVTRDSVTGSVTLKEEEERKRELARVRQQNRRIRQRGVTVTRDSVTGTVTPSSSPPPSPSDGRGSLRVVTQAARDSQRDRQRDTPLVHRSPDTLPKPVQQLREAWNSLVAVHGFPEWGEHTSARMLEDAVAALERRPLDEWRRVFALVPRSPVCRGELGSRQRASVVWLLAGRCSDGYEPAEKLLAGAWSLDPEPKEDEPEPGSVVDCNHLAPGPGGEAALKTWEQVLAQLRMEKRTQALKNLECAAPVTVEGEKLVLWCSDSYSRTWLEDIYMDFLLQHLVPLGLSGVRFVHSDEPSSDQGPAGGHVRAQGLQ